ncbi:MAG: hypothetical protein MHM6MM_004725 [Cercozoa sp. M6MM]
MQQARKRLKEGEKLLKGGLFSKSDPVRALRAFEEAADAMRRSASGASEWQECLLVLQRAAVAAEAVPVPNTAGKHLSAASKLATRQLDDIDMAIELLKRASRMFLAGDHVAAAVKALSDAAVLVADSDFERSLELFQQACLLVEDTLDEYSSGSTAAASSHEIFDRTVAHCATHKRWAECREALLRQCRFMDHASNRETFKAWLRQAWSHAIVVSLVRNDVAGAARDWSEAQQCQAMAGTEASQQLSRLIQAVASADQSEVQQVLRHTFFGSGGMRPRFARLAKKLQAAPSPVSLNPATQLGASQAMQAPASAAQAADDEHKSDEIAATAAEFGEPNFA